MTSFTGKPECKVANSIFTKEFNDKFTVTLDNSLPSNMEYIIDIINKKRVEDMVVSLEERYKTMLKENSFWQGEAIDNIEIPIGYVNPKLMQRLVLGKTKDTNDYFGLIGGLSGYGKTILLHNIILWGAMEYSPFELEYYLIDCKNGTGFKPYQNLPHTKILSMSNDREFALSSMTVLVSEMNRREVLFRDANVTDIHHYRQETGVKLPRILAIIDEFQVLFENDDKIARTIRDSLNKIFTRGRASGINVLLSSQKIGRVDLPVADITWRLSFRLKSEFESQRIILNDSALKLTKVGNAIINIHNGDKNEDINFQVGNIIEKNIKTYVDDLSKAFTERYPDQKMEDKFISDGDNSARIERNNVLSENIINKSFKVNDRYCDVYIGEPAFIRNEHARIRIRKQAGSNVILVGSDIKSAVSIIGLINYQLIRQSSQQSKFYIIDCFNIDNEYCDCFDVAKKYFGNQIFVYNTKKIDTVIDGIEAELQHRIDKENEGERVSGRIMLSVAYMQNCRPLKKEGYNASPVAKKLVRILKEGAEYGIHVLLYSLNYQGVTDILETSVLNEFENRIALDSGKSMSIISEQIGTKITEKGSALLQAPDEVTTYNPDLIRVYSQCNIDANSDDVEYIVELLKI